MVVLARRGWRRLVGHLPAGRGLPPDVWRARHHVILTLLWAHVAGLVVYGLVFSSASAGRALLGTAAVALWALGAGIDRWSRAARSITAALGLAAASFVLVNLADGAVATQFHAFVVIATVALYHDWAPFLVAMLAVVTHCVVLGALVPDLVGGSSVTGPHPLRDGFVRGAFEAAAGIACVAGWRVNEDVGLRDALTRLPNRRLLHDRLDHAIARASRSGEPLALLFIDLDDFKTINDSLGHAAGDTLLGLVGERLLSLIRPADTAARIGGDEFAVLVEDLAGRTDAESVAQRLVDGFAVPFSLRAKQVVIGVSIGIAYAVPGSTTEELLRNADLAMYSIKRSGRSGFAVFESEMHRAMVSRAEIERELRAALLEDQIVVHYQPVVRLADESIVGFEALMRWQHPDRGLLGPGEYLEVAEQSGVIAELGAIVLDRACADLRRLRELVPHASPTMAVNVSPSELLTDRLVERISSTLDGHRLPPDALVLEVTEGSLVEDSPRSSRRLAELDRLGVLLALDDFGTGWSSLGYLQRYPFDVLKIDRRFIDGIVASPTDEALCRAIVQLGDGLGLETVAEGVESVAQADVLRSFGCAMAQGYHFALPLPIDAVVERVCDGRLVLARDAQDPIARQLNAD